MERVGPKCACFVSVFLLVVTAGCTGDGSNEGGSIGSIGSIPADLVTILNGAGVSVDNISAPDRSPADALDAFAGTYKLEEMPETPTAYAIHVTSDGDYMLADENAWLLHVTLVQQPSCPAPEKRSFVVDPRCPVEDTEMFAFFEIETGRHLSTLYLARVCCTDR